MICAPSLAPVIFALLLSMAPDDQKVDPRETEARKECLAGRHQSGTELLAQLFAETANPNYVFNQGRCFQQNGKFDEAILRFQEFLRIGKNLSVEAKAEADRHLAECQAAKVHEGAGGVATQGETVASQPAVEASGSVSPTEVTATGASGDLKTAPVASPAAIAVQTGGEPRAGSSVLRTAGIVTGAVGVAAMAAGVVFSLETKSVRNEVTSDNARRSFDRNKYDNGKLYSHLQWVGYGVGSAAIVAGAVLYYLGSRDVTPATGSIGVAPSVSANQVSLTLQGSY